MQYVWWDGVFLCESCAEYSYEKDNIKGYCTRYHVHYPSDSSDNWKNPPAMAAVVKQIQELLVRQRYEEAII